MNYLTNEDGDIKVRYQNGIEKFLPKKIAEDKHIAKGHGFEIVLAPVKFEPIIPPMPDIEIHVTRGTHENDVHFETRYEVETKEKTADAAHAKRGRKPNQK